MTTNATVEEQHKDEAKLSWINPDDMDAYERRFAQALANLEAARAESQCLMENLHGTALQLKAAEEALEAARAENADLTNRLAEIDRLIREEGNVLTSYALVNAIQPLATGHTPSPCTSCAAKDAEIAIWQGKAETFGRACSEKDEAITKAMDLGVTEEAWDVLKPYRIPPADPLAEALNSAIDVFRDELSKGSRPSDARTAAIGELKSRLGGAK